MANPALEAPGLASNHEGARSRYSTPVESLDPPPTQPVPTPTPTPTAAPPPPTRPSLTSSRGLASPSHRLRIIVAGASGYVGINVVKQCIQHVLVDEVIIVTRRLIPDSMLRNPKVKMILHDQFSQWPDELLEQLKGCQGCIWTIGGKVESFPNAEEARKVGIGYTVVAAEAFRDKLAAFAEPHKPFRFVYCSASGAERNQHARLWTQSESRKIKGAAENGIFDIAGINLVNDAVSDTHGSPPKEFDAFSLRSGGILAESSGLFGAGASAIFPTTRIDILAKALIEVCRKGANKHILENKDINEIGGLESALAVNSMML